MCVWVRVCVGVCVCALCGSVSGCVRCEQKSQVDQKGEDVLDTHSNSEGMAFSLSQLV